MHPDFGPERAERPATLTDLLRFRLRRQPDQLAYAFLPGGEGPEVRLTYRQLDQQARAVALSLRELDTAGQRVLLLYPSGLDFIAAFFGCLYAGMVAVPAYPPDPARLNRSLPRLRAIARDAQATIVLAEAGISSMSRSLFAQAPEFDTFRWIATDGALAREASDEWKMPSVQGEDIAFLQYTSGSTGTPKGVMLSHSNLLHNASMVYNAVEHQAGDTYVSWLPMFHDMGFMAGVLQPLYAGIPAILMSPVSFLQDPIRWLRALSRNKATTSGGPNFAYDLCVRKVRTEQLPTLDLTSWSVAFNGAEPIHAETLDRFARKFQPCGFRRETFFPCYGLAEATLIVSGLAKAAAPVIKSFDPEGLKRNRVIQTEESEAGANRLLVGCGQPLGDQRVAIVDPETSKTCSAGQVGEIWVSGPSVAMGYWNLQEPTQRSFRACISATGEGPFLRTGDLGFLQEGQLFITGRLKDLIIIRGANHYPQDIELVVEQCHDGLKPGCGAAFSIEANDQEQLVIVQEAEPNKVGGDINLVFESIRKAVAEAHELQPYAIALIKPGTIPKTSSGKIQRRECKEQFLADRLSVIAGWRQALTWSADEDDSFPAVPPASLGGTAEVQSWLVSLFARKTGVTAEEIDVDCSIARYGLDSLMAIEISQSIESQLGVELPMATLLQGCSISELVSQAAQPAQAAPATPAGDREARAAGGPPLSHGQRGLWFLQQIAPDSVAYNIARAARVVGRVDVASMRRAFEGLVSRHECLRTTFAITDSEPIQEVHDGILLDFQFEDASGWSESLLQGRLAEEANRPFDLGQGPLLRISLLRRSEQEHILLLVVHHIVTDFWSLGVFLQEFGLLYQAGVAGTEASLGPLPARYTDYVRGQAELLEGVEGERLWSFWEQHLAGAPHVLHFPVDHPRPAVQTYTGASLGFELDEQSTEGMKALGGATGSTLFTTLLAVFQTLLLRYSGQTDFLLGSPTAGRKRGGFAGVIGYFVNPIVLRADLSGDPTFDELLGRARDSVLSALAHQEYPFPLLVERLQPARDPSRSPLFQVMLALQKTHLLNDELLSLALGEEGARVELGGIVLEPMQLQQRIAQFDFTLMVADIKGRLRGSLEYNTDILDGATMARAARHFQALVRSIVRDPRTRLSQLSLFTQPELDQFLSESNRVAVEYSADTRLDLLFAVQCARVPDREALYFEGASLSYRELDRRVNQLAHFLRSRGVDLEDPIGVCLDRSIETIISLLAVLKSSAAFVPLDPSYPRQRLAFMIEDAGVKLTITQRRHVDALPDSIESICLDECFDEISASSRSAPRTTATPQNLAYVIYTSGTTGAPKGTMISHEAAVNAILWFEQNHRDDAPRRMLHKSSLSFDVSVWEIFWPLVSGGTIVIARPGGQYDSSYLADILHEQQITTMSFAPVMLRRMIEETAFGECKSLQYVACGADVVPADLVKDFLDSAGARLENVYGPTETTIASTSWHCRILPDQRVPIGIPFGNTRVFILNETLQPVPIGAAGEIFIAGTGLARGYLERPDLTAERFIPDPFSQAPGGRLYRTGDLGRHASDYNIEYLERKDHQIKLRGYRIELDEIQHALRGHPGVADSVVVARENGAAEKHLVAYVVATGAGAASPADLRSLLKQSLPDYMIPSAFAFLDRLPLTPNGKVDREALPDVAQIKSAAREDVRAPGDYFEEMIAGVWADVLKTDLISVTDNFFNLGGHSLLATQIIFRLRKLFQVDLAVHEIFEMPTVEALARRVRSAAEGRRELTAPPIAPVSRDVDLPLSFAQLRMWLLDKLGAGSAVYSIPVAVRLKGPVNWRAVEQAANEIVRRHEVLRTRFTSSESDPVQVIDPELILPLAIIDLAGLSERGSQECRARLAAEEAGRPFDLAIGPLLRINVLRHAEGNHVLLLTMHHIVSDGWSLGIFLREFETIYEAVAEGRPSPLSDLPIQYADFACWQREWLQGANLDTPLSYWKRQLSGDLPVLDLPSDYPRPAVKSFRGSTVPISLSGELGSELAALSRRESATLFMTLLSAFGLLLRKYTHQQDLLIGTPVSGRNIDSVEGLIGCFINTLVIRLDLSGELDFRGLLARTRGVCLGAYAHQELPFERLVDELEIERSLARNPLFQAMFELQTEITREPRPAQSRMTFIDVERNSSKFDLTLNLIQSTSNHLNGYIEFSTDLYEAVTIERMARHLETLLEAITKDETVAISQVSIISEAELNQLIYEWNGPNAERAGDACIHHLFESQAERTPDAVAVVFEDSALSYRGLDLRANQLAHYLLRLGIHREARVGVCIERSLEMLVAMFGALKAGTAYMPFDPSYPADRLAFMLKDSQARILLTQQRLIERLPERRPETVCLDSGWEMIAQSADNKLVGFATSEQPAYVLYTSGSTGRPKGVVVGHRQLCNYVEGVKQRLNLENARSFALVSTFAADLGNTVIFPALATGGCLHVISEEIVSDADEMHEYFRNNSIDCVKIVPSHLASLRSFSTSRELLPEKLLVLGGEASQSRWVEELQALESGCAVFNHYGPTEATVGVLTYRFEGTLPHQVPTLPLGRPLPNTQVYVVDGDLQPVPIGVPGEILIGGAGLSDGYVNGPDMTAERFIPCPFGGGPGARLYKTGDLARRLPDGNLEFLGRGDDQIKVRGFRIELGEIESAIHQHPAVREAVVLAVGEHDQGKRIVSYVVVDEEAGIGGADLRSFLNDKLPDYMVPSGFLLLDSIPLTSNGKIDRRALPAPDFSSLAARDGNRGPRNPVEEVISNVWTNVLGVEQIGIEDNFFELGGNSLLATKVVSRLRAALQAGLPLRRLFESPTVAGLAAFVKAERTKDSYLAVPPIARTSRQATLPLSYSQWRLWFIDQLTPGTPIYNVAVALRLSGPISPAILARSMNEIVSRHEVLRATFPQQNNRPVQVIARALDLSMPVVDLSDPGIVERDEMAKERAEQVAWQPFNLAEGPLLRVELLRLGAQEHVMLLAIHHIACDDWSVGIFNRELSETYRSLSAGAPSTLAELNVQYTDFACWQQQFLKGENLEAEIRHWKSRLGDTPPILDLPTDHPRPAVQSFGGSTIRFELGSAPTEGLKAMGLQQGATLFMTLLAGFAVLLHRYSGQQKITIGVPIANRNYRDTEELIGFFTNILVLGLDFSGNPSYGEMLGRVREATLDAYDHQDMPFEKLVEAFQLKRDRSRAPLRQVAFAYEQASPEELNLPGVNVSRMQIENWTSRLDMTLFMREAGGVLRGSIEYNSDLFEPSTISRIIESYKSLLEDMVSGLQRTILSLPLAIGAERKAAPVEKDAGLAREERIEDQIDRVYAHSNMTANQLLFWFAKKLQADAPLYFENVIIKLVIEGDVRRDSFQAAFQALIDSSDVLRSTIIEVDGLPRRKVHDSFPFTVEYLDFSESENGQSASERWLERQYETTLNFETRLFDCALLKVPGRRFIWLFKVSHMICDMWSVRLMVGRVSDYYKSSVEGGLHGLAPLCPYQDYVDEERKYRQSDAYRKAQRYWREKLSYSPSLPQFYRVDLSKETTLTGRVSHNLGSELSGRIKELSSRNGLLSPAVVFATVLFAYQRRLTGEATLRLGSPFAHRPDAFKQTVGLCVSVCALQVDIERDDSFLSLARKVQREFINTSRHQRYPVRTPVEGRVFNVYLNYQIASFSEFAGMALEFDLVQTRHFNDTLTLQARDFDGSGKYVLDFNFNCDAFDRKQRERSLGHFLALLEAFVDKPEQPVAGAQMLSSHERRQIIDEFNQTERDYGGAFFMHHIIEEQASRTPASVAVIFEDQQVTYSELNERANQLAHFLRRRGVELEAYVGVCMERSPEMVISLLGILKAGAAYVPLDPTYPKERLSFMLADSGVSVLLTQSRFAELAAESTARIMRVDTEWDAVAGEARTNPKIEMAGENLAYMIYTSGSTGQPKGVMINHAGIRNRVLWARERYSPGQNDRVFQKTPFSFDPSVWEFLLPLCAGGSIVLAAPGGQRDPQYVVDMIARTKATMMHIVTPMLRAVLLTENLERCRDLRLIIVGAEQVQFEDQERFYERLPWAVLENLYGPTEASIDVTYWKCLTYREGHMVPIGRPIANVKLHILDSHLMAVPVGVSGELHIGGIALMRGYHNRPDLTAEKMMPDPYGTKGERLYKSGDLSRYREDGEIEFLGRIDTQIKIRGFRVELGEIEAALARHPAIREAVVISREDKPGQQRLVAYFVTAAGHTVSASDLRSALKESLPDYMIPSVFVPLNALPLHPNSKLNRKALPAPEDVLLKAETTYEAPSSPLEKLLADIWMEVLAVEKVGVREDFFEVGGQSILATQFISRVQQVLPGTLTLQAIFQAPTIAGLAEIIMRSQSGQEQAEKHELTELVAKIQGLSDEEVRELLREDSIESLQEMD